MTKKEGKRASYGDALVRLEILWEQAEKWQEKEEKLTLENRDKLIKLNGQLPAVFEDIREVKRILIGDDNKSGLVAEMITLKDAICNHIKNDWIKYGIMVGGFLVTVLLVLFKLAH